MGFGVPFYGFLYYNLISDVFQNHDNQANITHAEEISYMQKVSPLTYTRAAPDGVGGFGGEGNYWVPVSNSSKTKNPYPRAFFILIFRYTRRKRIAPRF
jgi:hypothetical protein